MFFGHIITLSLIGLLSSTLNYFSKNIWHLPENFARTLILTWRSFLDNKNTWWSGKKNKVVQSWQKNSVQITTAQTFKLTICSFIVLQQNQNNTTFKVAGDFSNQVFPMTHGGQDWSNIMRTASCFKNLSFAVHWFFAAYFAKWKLQALPFGQSRLSLFTLQSMWLHNVTLWSGPLWNGLRVT